ncbi:MAG: Do family serine endopeptidase [Spirochaetales bacterium]|nr:Do family serine endopeptidase [Spirochaetales bacterium]
MNVQSASRKIIRNAIAGLGIVLLAFLFLGAKDPSQAQMGLQTLKQMQDAFHVVAAKVVPTVVEIHVVDITRGPVLNFNPFDFGNNPPRTREFRRPALGSGVIVERRGNTVYVLTNNHVAGSAASIQVRLSDNRTFPATLVGKDENKDLALVSFTTSDQVPIAELGDSNSVQVGDWVLAIGNPLGFTGTLTAGIVSAVGRDYAQANGAGFTNYIQTDAAINQGNSGGALVNIEGQVIGINTWIASNSGGSVGLGFAIPINNAKKDINDLITKGKVEYGWMGVTVGDLSATLARDMNLPSGGGSLVSGVFTNGPAATAGLLPGDYVTAIGSDKAGNTSRLLQLIANLTPGDTAALSLVRDGRPHTVRVTLATRADANTLSAQANVVWPGFGIDSLSPDIRSALNIPNGLRGAVVLDVPRGSRGDAAGLRQGDVIISLDNHQISNGADFYRYLNLVSSRSSIELRVNRGGSPMTFTLTK